MKFQTIFGATALTLALAAPAFAQNGVKKVDDWMVRCANVESASPCDMNQLLINNNTKQRVLMISIAYVPHVNRHTMMIAVPLGVELAKGVVVTAGSFKSPVMKFRRCDQEGCYVELFPEESLIQAMSAGTTATVTVTTGDGKAVPIGFSLKGFSAAHDDMAAQARQKAKAPPAAETTTP